MLKFIHFKLLFGLVILFSICQSGFSQEVENNSINLFLDCRCDSQFIKQEISYINYVRDRKVSDIHLRIISMRTGGGGREYTLVFNGQREYHNMSDTLIFTMASTATSDEIRRQQVKYIKGGLFRYIVNTDIFDQLDIRHSNSVSKQPDTEDLWNNWVFNIGTSGNINAESSKTRGRFRSNFSASKITDDWKLRFNANYSLDKSNINYETTSISTKTESYNVNALVVRSINEHWSIGGRANLISSIYQNYKKRVILQPAIEYNFFPYSEAVTKQLLVQYRIGPEILNYHDTTIYDVTRQSLLQHSVSTSYKTKQEWGNITTSLAYSNYLNDWSFNRIRFNNNFNIRVVKGLSARLSMGASIIHDQINLAKGGATEEELLTQQKEIATDFNLYSSIGLNYTFGSIYNNIVNSRFGG